MYAKQMVNNNSKILHVLFTLLKNKHLVLYILGYHIRITLNDNYFAYILKF